MQQTTPRKPDRPVLWIVAGPNGSGKSSLYNRSDIEGWGGSVWIINPDLLTAKIVEHEKRAMSEANLAAVQRVYSVLNLGLKLRLKPIRQSVLKRFCLLPSTSA